MVGAVRFELTTSCTRNKRASQATLRPEPEQPKVLGIDRLCNSVFLFGHRFCVKRSPCALKQNAGFGEEPKPGVDVCTFIVGLETNWLLLSVPLRHGDGDGLQGTISG